MLGAGLLTFSAVLRDGIRMGRERPGQMLLLRQKCIPDKMNFQVDNLQSCYYTVTFLLINDKSMSHSRKESPDNSRRYCRRSDRFPTGCVRLASGFWIDSSGLQESRNK